MRGLESACGLILLTGEIGVGKTSLSRYVQGFLADRFVFVELGNPYQTPLEQIYHCCERFNVERKGMSSLHDCIDELEKQFHSLLKQGKRPVIVFDESHLLTKKHLGLIHILSNLRAENGPLVQIIIVGQLEILDLLSVKGMEALNQRVGVRCRLEPLIKADVDKYIRFKLETGGRAASVTFAKRAVKSIWQESGGVPRLINHICAHALDALAFRNTNVVSAAMIDEVCRDSMYSGLFASVRRQPKEHRRRWGLIAGATAALLLVAVGWNVWQGAPERIASAGGRSKVSPIVFEERTSVPFQDTGIEAVPPVSESNDTVPMVEEPEFLLAEPENGEQEALQLSRPGSDGGIGDVHPVIGKLVLGAIAWNNDVSKSIAVVDSKLVHVGGIVNGVSIEGIGKDHVLFGFEGKTYKRSIQNKNGE